MSVMQAMLSYAMIMVGEPMSATGLRPLSSLLQNACQIEQSNLLESVFDFLSTHLSSLGK
jgi:hypothetical protein